MKHGEFSAAAGKREPSRLSGMERQASGLGKSWLPLEEAKAFRMVDEDTTLIESEMVAGD